MEICFLDYKYKKKSAAMCLVGSYKMSVMATLSRSGCFNAERTRVPCLVKSSHVTFNVLQTGAKRRRVLPVCVLHVCYLATPSQPPHLKENTNSFSYAYGCFNGYDKIEVEINKH